MGLESRSRWMGFEPADCSQWAQVVAPRSWETFETGMAAHHRLEKLGVAGSR
jgi:hypothetical protein